MHSFIHSVLLATSILLSCAPFTTATKDAAGSRVLAPVLLLPVASNSSSLWQKPSPKAYQRKRRQLASMLPAPSAAISTVSSNASLDVIVLVTAAVELLQEIVVPMTLSQNNTIFHGTTTYTTASPTTVTTVGIVNAQGQVIIETPTITTTISAATSAPTNVALASGYSLATYSAPAGMFTYQGLTITFTSTTIIIIIGNLPVYSTSMVSTVYITVTAGITVTVSTSVAVPIVVTPAPVVDPTNGAPLTQSPVVPTSIISSANPPSSETADHTRGITTSNAVIPSAGLTPISGALPTTFESSSRAVDPGVASSSNAESRVNILPTSVSVPTAPYPTFVSTSLAVTPTTLPTNLASPTPSPPATSSNTVRTPAATPSSPLNTFPLEDGREVDLSGLSFPFLNQAPWIQAMLEQHNSYRARHNAPPMTWNEELVKTAYTRVRSGVFAHDPNNPFGENIAAGGYSSPLFYVYAFYNEVTTSDYNFATATTNGKEGGHFTQLVWNDSLELGCAYVDNSGIQSYPFYLACEYAPPGNYIGTYPQHVFAPNSNPYPTEPNNSI